MRKRIAISLAVLFAAGTFARAAEIHLRPECVCESALVKLGDVAEIIADDEIHALQLAGVELFPAPSAGQIRQVSVRELYDLLAARNVNLRENRLAGANSIRISGTTARPVAAVVDPPAPTVKEENLVQVVVAVRPLARGQRLTDGDVQLASVPSGNSRAEAAVDLSSVLGRELTLSIRAGQAVPHAALQSPRLVSKNEIVTLLVRAHGIQVRTSAKAMDEGGLDDLIRLQSLLDRGTVYTARICGYKEAEILAGAPRIEETPKSVSRNDHRETDSEREIRANTTASLSKTPTGSATQAMRSPPRALPVSPAKTGSLFGLRVRAEDAASTNR